VVREESYSFNIPGLFFPAFVRGNPRVVAAQLLGQGGQLGASLAHGGHAQDVEKRSTVFVGHVDEQGDEVVWTSGRGDAYHSSVLHVQQGSDGFVPQTLVYVSELVDDHHGGPASFGGLTKELAQRDEKQRHEAKRNE
jgi:hypothetical protein